MAFERCVEEERGRGAEKRWKSGARCWFCGGRMELRAFRDRYRFKCLKCGFELTDEELLEMAREYLE